MPKERRVETPQRQMPAMRRRRPPIKKADHRWARDAGRFGAVGARTIPPWSWATGWPVKDPFGSIRTAPSRYRPGPLRRLSEIRSRAPQRLRKAIPTPEIRVGAHQLWHPDLSVLAQSTLEGPILRADRGEMGTHALRVKCWISNLMLARIRQWIPCTRIECERSQSEVIHARYRRGRSSHVITSFHTVSRSRPRSSMW